MSALLLAAAVGLVAGVLAGMFGVGGGILFVPTLALVLGLTQLEAQATSLAAVVPVVLLGAWRQHAYGNLRLRPALVIGVASLVGVVAGVALATSLPDETLRRLFALLLVAVAAQVALSGRAS